MGSKDKTQVIRLGGSHLYCLNHVISPYACFQKEQAGFLLAAELLGCDYYPEMTKLIQEKYIHFLKNNCCLLGDLFKLVKRVLF